MKMNVEYGLSGVNAVIDDHAVSAFVKTALRSDRFGDKEQVADKIPVGSGNSMNVGDMFFGDNEEMDGRLRIEVFKRENQLVLVDNGRGDLFFDDPAKNAVWIGAHFFSHCAFPAKLRKKQERSPVWQAGPVCSTLMRSVSWSQS